MSKLVVFLCSAGVLLLAVFMVSVAAAQTAPVPVISSVSPQPAMPGQPITITGSNFGATQGTSYLTLYQHDLTLGGTAKTDVSYTSWSDSSITFTVSTAAQLDAETNLTVTTGAGVSLTSRLLLEAQPAITSISPTVVAAGQKVTVSGSNFGFGQETNYLKFTDGSTNWGAPGNSATFNTPGWSTSAIGFTVPTPSGANGGYHVTPGTTAHVAVAVGSFPAATGSVQIATAAQTPTVTSITPANPKAGDEVTINGANFGSTQGSSFVTFTDDGTVWGATTSTPALSIVGWSNTQIKFTMPEPSGTNNTEYYLVPGSIASVFVTVGGVQSALAQVPIFTTPPTSAAITVALNPGNANPVNFSKDLAGLSYEMNSVRSDIGGGANLNAGMMTGTPGPYSNLIKAMGVRHFRLGGDSVEDPSAYPTQTDANHVSDFAQIVGADVLWDIPEAGRYNVAYYTAFAKSIVDYKASKGYTFQTVFAIGNENGPNASAYEGRFLAYLTSFKQNISPTILLAGPSAGHVGSYYFDFESYAKSNNLTTNMAFLTAHYYDLGAASGYATINSAVQAILSPVNAGNFRGLNKSWGGGFNRLEEASTMFGGGKPGASDAFASALWVLDCLGFFSTTTMNGLDFHAGPGGTVLTTGYTPIFPAGVAPSYTVLGIGYGLLAFNQLGQGRSVPVTLTNPSAVNFTAYAVLQTNGNESVALINKTSNNSGTVGDVDASVTLQPGGTYTKAQVMYLQAPNSDPTSLFGMTLGGKGFAADGTWSGTYGPILPVTAGAVTVTVPHTTAAIVRFIP